MTNSKLINPMAESGRKGVLDFLRGVALLGILLVNMAFFSTPIFSLLSMDAALWDDLPNRVVRGGIWFFLEGKFYPMFSLLFGVGFYFYLQKGADSVGKVLAVWRMRLLYLLIFGLLHAFLLWYGDILIVYSLTGFALAWFARSSNKALLIWAVVFLLFPVVVITGLVGLMQLAMHIPEVSHQFSAAMESQSQQIAYYTQKAIDVYSSGSYGDIFRMRLLEFSQSVTQFLFIIPPLLALFITGFYLARKRVFHDLDQGLKVLKKVFWWALPVALGMNFLYLWFMMHGGGMGDFFNWSYALVFTGVMIGGPAMTLVYVYLLSLIYHRGYCKSLTGMIANTGRMAFTNYLTQSIICTTIFYAYGFGLYGKVNYWQGLLLAIVIYAVQVVWSKYWLRHFRFGPLEWLWRSLTYRKWQPIKRSKQSL